MTDDFGGKLQDIEKKQDEDGNEDESDVEEEEPDKEMGDTEKGAETLDQQVKDIINSLKLNKPILLDIYTPRDNRYSLRSTFEIMINVIEYIYCHDQ